MKYGVWYSYCFDEYDSDNYNIGYIDNVSEIENLLKKDFKPPLEALENWSESVIDLLKIGECIYFGYKGWSHGIYVTAVQNEKDDEHYLMNFDEVFVS